MSTYLVNSPSQTVDDVVSNIIASTRLPISQITFTPQNIIGFLQDEQDITITNMVHVVREDFWVTNYDQQIQNNVYTYTMPPRAVGGTLRTVVFVDQSGNEITVPHLDSDQIATPSYFAFRPSWQGQGYFLQDNKVVLWPQSWSNTAYQLRQRYERQPNALCSYAYCMQITGVDTNANTITFAGSPPFTAGMSLDIISILGQHVSQADDLLIATVPGGTITIDSSTPIPSTVTVGSWACPAGLTCIPQIPREAYALLMARGMLRIAVGLQSSSLAGVATKMCDDAAMKMTSVITPRVNGSPKKFVNKNVVGGPCSYPYYR